MSDDSTNPPPTGTPANDGKPPVRGGAYWRYRRGHAPSTTVTSIETDPPSVIKEEHREGDPPPAAEDAGEKK